jgi:hypothetical protein
VVTVLGIHRPTSAELDAMDDLASSPAFVFLEDQVACGAISSSTYVKVSNFSDRATKRILSLALLYYTI